MPGRSPLTHTAPGAPRRINLAGLAAVWGLTLLVPVAGWTPGADPGVPLRLVVVGMSLLLGLAAIVWGQRAGTSLTPALAWTGLAGLAVVAVGALAGPTPALGLLGRYPRFEGLPMLAAYLAVFGLGAALVGRDASRRGHLLAGLAWLQLVLLVGAVIETLTDPGARVATLLGNASDAGVVGVVGFAVLTWQATRQAHWLLWTGSAASAGLVALTASRGAWLGVGVVVAAGLVMVAVQRGWRRAWPAALPLLAGLVVALATPLAGQTVSGRLLLWRESLRLWWDHPWLGVGPSRFVDEIGRYHTADWARLVGPEAPPDAPHNMVVQVLASSGLAGLAVAGVFAVLVARALWRNRRDDFTAGAFLALVGAGTCYGFHFTALWNITPLLLVAGAACYRAVPGPTRLTALARLGCLATALVCLGLGAQSMVAEARLARGLEQAQTGSGPGVSTILAAIDTKPYDPDLAWRAGHALTVLAGAGLAPPQVAVEVLTPACQRLPGAAECLNDLALAHLRAGDPAQALRIGLAAQQRDAANTTTLLIVGSAKAQSGDPAGAEAAYRRAAELRPSAPEPWVNLAELYAQLGRAQDAQAAQQRADELS